MIESALRLIGAAALTTVLVGIIAFAAFGSWTAFLIAIAQYWIGCGLLRAAFDKELDWPSWAKIQPVPIIAMLAVATAPLVGYAIS
jgi:hypothetical protein